MKKIVFKNTDGGVILVTPCEPMLQEETEKQYFDRIEAKLRKKGRDSKGNICAVLPDDNVRVGVLAEEDILADTKFRGAWTCTSSDPIIIGIDFPKAQEITKNRLRAERKPLLEALDVEVMKNITNTTKLAEIESKKQVLRDITKKADECKTLDELKGLKTE